MSDKKKISEKDQKDWEDFLKNPLNVSEKEIDQSIKDKNLKFKFDLHGYSIDNANKKVTEIIENCYSKGFSEILLIGIVSKKESILYKASNIKLLIPAVEEAAGICINLSLNLS